MKKRLKAEVAGPGEFEKTAVRVSLFSIIGNAILVVFKLFAGIVGHSAAMISDAVHSASDVLSSIIVIVGVRLSGREADSDHPYGHERMECVAAIILAGILAITGGGIGLSALESILDGDAGGVVIPGLLALIAAIVSIVTKEGMYRYTVHFARMLDSASLMASAWDHRSDALSSVGALVGIAGARMGYPVLEHIASIVICLFILKAALDIFREAMDKMVDHSAGDEIENAIRECALQQPRVLGVDLIRTREFGSRVYVDIEISADGDLTLRESHEVSQQVHDAIESSFDKVKHIMVHVNPMGDDGHGDRVKCAMEPK
ncbi:MAG: cation transporter [Oscillospiraceae bacterium]|nr:cation transporter [Oscillospiraceae bacterium]